MVAWREWTESRSWERDCCLAFTAPVEVGVVWGRERVKGALVSEL